MRVWFIICCGLLLVAFGPAAYAAPDKYERVTEQLSQTIGSYQELSRQEEKYDVVFRRDPMRALIDAQGQLVTSIGLHEGLSVQGVIWSEERPLVVIEDELFAKGDVIGPYTIREIHTDGIVAQRGDELQVIPLDRGLE